MKKTNETNEKFDGYIDLVEPTETGGYKTTPRVKLFLSDDEAREVLGDADPNIYFNQGRVPIYFTKSVGRRLPADRLEEVVKAEVFSQFPEVLLFKHDLQNIYTLLIPKKLSEFELNQDGEFAERLVSCDTRSIVFTGGHGRPAGYEPGYFKEKANLIKKHLLKKAEDRKVY